MINPLKLDRPPAVENWSRTQYPEVQKTAKKLFSFLKGGPIWNYNVTRDCGRYYIEDQIDLGMARKIVESKGSPIGRPYNREAVEALFAYFGENPLDVVRGFDQMVEWFPLGPKIVVPVKPMAVIRHDGGFSPVFLNPWAEIGFDSYQASLYMTVIEESIFRITDFENSSGKIIFLPKHEAVEGGPKRKAVVWERGQFPLLSKTELNDQVRIFLESKRLAQKWAKEFNESEGQK